MVQQYVWETAKERLYQIDKRIGRALAAIAGDPDASPALARAVGIFHRQSHIALQALDGSDREQRGVEALDLQGLITKVERAGQNARRAAEIDQQANAATRHAVFDAQQAITRLREVTFAQKPLR